MRLRTRLASTLLAVTTAAAGISLAAIPSLPGD